MKLLLTIAVIASVYIAKAQYGNEWINYNQSYYSFKISEDGIYKIDYNALNAAGFPVGSVQSSDLQLWGFEKEQALFIEDGGDNVLNPGDYILFYAEDNNTWLDSLMYDDPNNVSNKYFPHYNDTITYFLSYNSTTTNKRIIVETDVNYSGVAPNPYVLKTDFLSFNDTYVSGFTNAGLSYSQYVNAEGWSGDRKNALSPTNFFVNAFFSTSLAYTGSDAPAVTGLAVSSGASNAPITNNGNHHVQLKNMTSNAILTDLVFSGYQKNNFNFSFPVTDLGASSTNIRHEFIDDLGVAADQQVVHFVELTYPRIPNAGNNNYFECEVVNNPNGPKAHYLFTNLQAAVPFAFVIDGNVMRKIAVVVNGGNYHVVIPNSANGRQKLIIGGEATFNQLGILSPVNGTGSFTNYASVNFENAALLVTQRLLWPGATDYKNYRESAAGGNYNAQLIDVDELYLQFGGGVPKHPFGIRRFVHFVYNNTTTKPNHLFLIGKSVREASQGTANGVGMRQSAAQYEQCLVPSFGYPASDVLITANLDNNPYSPLIPTGRIAANSSAEVVNYLEKVKAFELAQDPNSVYSIASKLWQKEILHFGGGTTAFEQSLFKNYLSNYENSLEGANFGGNVTSVYKTVSDPIDPVTQTQINENINNGVSFMTFFGHGSPTGFDVNVDDVANWNNQGKYPILIGNSCFSGNIHEPVVFSFSEESVLIPNKGAIAFIANVSQGFPFGLDKYSNELFSQISSGNYGGTIGEQMKITCENNVGFANSFTVGTTLVQMTLHGDPALKPNPHQKPEIAIENPGVFITPDIVDLTVDSIDVNVVLYNLGRSVTDTFTLEVKRFFPNNGGDSTYFKTIAGLDYVDTVKVTMPLYANLGVGINQFEVRVDIPGVIAEQYDDISNNQVAKSFLFNIDGVYPIWPYNYAVVPDDSITIKASTVNPFAELLTYRFEIDTTDLFNSPQFKQASVTSTGGVLEVNPNEWKNGSNQPTSLVLTDSTAYFWRVAIDEPGNYSWQEFSFQHINGRRGWGQDHFFQFKNNDFFGLNYNRNDRRLTFDPISKVLECNVVGNATNIFQTQATNYKIDGANVDVDFCNLNPKLLVAVIDPNTLKPWGTQALINGTIMNPNNNFGNSNDLNSFNNCRARVEFFFAFEQHIPDQLIQFENMITSSIPDDYYVLIYSTRRLNYSEWDNHSPQMYSIFQNLGSDSISPGKAEVPYIAFYRKGDPSSFKEVYGQSVNDIIQLTDTITGFANQGTQTSTTIGPAKEWKTLYWAQSAEENPTTDSTRLKIYGDSQAGQKQLIVDTVFTNNDSILNLANVANINQFPMLQLEMATFDEQGNTAAQLQRWHVLYDPVPEAAITSTNGYYLTQDSLQEGDKILAQFDIANVSDYPMDSILINYWIEKSNHQLQPLPYPRQDSLRVGGLIQDTLTIPSVGLSDLNSLWVEVNPYNQNNVKDQPEMYHFNNIGQIPFNVVVDNENPILQVSFDNRFILNGDLVSPKSEVVISLKDENPFLLLNEEADTALFGIYLTDPNGTQRKLNFRNGSGEQLLEWVPATPSSKKFKIIYQGEFDQNGTYRLLVQGADKSGNISGDFDYDVEFEVDREASITNLMNYPNPFSTQTQFVFTLTGVDVPDEFTIQILTVTGKLVRTITRDELGAIHIGRNITDFRWDGRDDFGDQLANGVYLYRVITSLNGEALEMRESGADQYITKGFGKMYLLR